VKKLFLIPLILVLVILIAPKAEAKILSKDLVDKVILDSGYKFSLCTIDMKYDRTGQADNIFSVAEIYFEGNTDSYPCN
jgi:hypothetical protein